MATKTPDGFPPLTLSVMRALCALTALRPEEEEQGQKSLVACLDALYRAYWVEGRQTHEREVLGAVLTEVLGAAEAEKGE
jgi:protein-disulfide isomerase-like protein with CxxC motif